MNKDIAMKWADALESGEYQQGQHHLRTGDKYCCLGVLCDLSGLGQWKGRDEDDALTYITGDSDFSVTTLTEKVRTWADMQNWWGIFGTHEQRTDLTDLNDQGKTFKEIAQIIRENWENL